MGQAVGIDLGTTYSAVAYVNDAGKAEVILNSEGKPTTPSVLCLQPDGTVLFGDEAKVEQEFGSPNVASFYKRVMGNGVFSATYGGKSYDATDLSAIFLERLVQDASRSLGRPIDSAVITVPAYFGSRERDATIEAGERAGLNVLGLLNEPSAAAYAYGLTNEGGQRTVVIYDLGGGTFDVTVARVNADSIEVLGSDGDHQLGGKDWDDALASHMIDMLCEQEDVDRDDLDIDTSSMNYLTTLAEGVKKQLSTRDSATCKIKLGDVGTTLEVTRDDFEGATAHLLARTTGVVERLLADLSIGWSSVDGVVLVGGSTRMPAVADYVRAKCGKDPYMGIDPDQAVAIGAAIRAESLAKPQLLIAGSPAQSQVRGLKLLSDATAHAMGMIAESADGSRYVNSTIIPKNKTVPVRDSREYEIDSRVGFMEVYVLQGSNDRVLDNTVYAKYVVSGIQPEPGGVSRIEVTYGYTENATIEVSAMQMSSGAQLDVRQEPVEDDLSRFDGAPAANSAGSGAMRVTVAVDVSGSMSGSRMAETRRALSGFLDSVADSGTELSLVVFGTRVLEVVPFTADVDALRGHAAAIDVNYRDAGYGTAEPISFWLDTVVPRGGATNSLECLLVLTDGSWNGPDKACSRAAEAKQSGKEIIAIGIGSANESFLKRIATNSDFGSLISEGQLTQTFSSIGRAIATGSGLTLVG